MDLYATTEAMLAAEHNNYKYFWACGRFKGKMGCVGDRVVKKRC
jgi:hypothetical protein